MVSIAASVHYAAGGWYRDLTAHARAVMGHMRGATSRRNECTGAAVTEANARIARLVPIPAACGVAYSSRYAKPLATRRIARHGHRRDLRRNCARRKPSVQFLLTVCAHQEQEHLTAFALQESCSARGRRPNLKTLALVLVSHVQCFIRCA